MKRSPASAWNFLLSLEGQDEEANPPSSSSSSSQHGGTTTTTTNNNKPPPASSSSTPPSSGASTPVPRGVTAEQNELLHLNDGIKLVIAMVGLPARGKSHVARKVTNFLSWLGYAAAHFEVASFRREKLGPVKPEIFFDPKNEMSAEARAAVRGEVMDMMISWLRNEEGQVAIYDTSNATVEMRKALTDKLEKAFPTTTCRVIWIEVSCADPATIERNFFEWTIRSPDFQGLTLAQALEEFKKKEKNYLQSFVGLEEQARQQQDFRERASFIKISDLGKHVVAHNTMGYLESKLVSFVMNIHTEPRVVLLARHGQTDYNDAERIGGDSDLNEGGRLFARNLAAFCRFQEKNRWFLDRFANDGEAGVYANQDNVLGSSVISALDDPSTYVKFDAAAAVMTKSVEMTKDGVAGNGSSNNGSAESSSAIAEDPEAEGEEGANGGGGKRRRKVPSSSSSSATTTTSSSNASELVVWTSTAKRALQTTEGVRGRVHVPWNALCEIDAGSCEGMNYNEIKMKMPLEYAERQKDKFHWRYPRGESYADLTKRLEPVIFEIERQRRPVLVVAHRAVLRCLVGYFFGTPKAVIPYLPFRLHSVVKLSATKYGWYCERFALQPPVENDEGAHSSDLAVYRELMNKRRKSVAAATSADSA